MVLPFKLPLACLSNGVEVRLVTTLTAYGLMRIATL